MRTLLKLIFWFVLWVPTWLLTVWTKKDGQENCMTWAMSQWEENNDGYLVVRWCRSSRYPWFRWPHFLYLPAQHHHSLVHFIPVDNTHDLKRFPEPWFVGYVKHGDDKDDASEN